MTTKKRTATCCCCLPTCAGMCCSVISLIGGLLLLGLAAWSVLMYRKLTPVFTDVDCTLRVPELAKVSFEGGFHLDYLYGADCHNPNPYHVTLRSPRTANVYVGKQKAEVATNERPPDVVLMPDGNGTLNAFVDMSPTDTSFASLFGTSFSRQTKLLMEVSVEVVIDVNLKLKKIYVAKNFTKICGFNMQVYRTAIAQAGPMACADTLEKLVLPDVGDEAYAGKLGLNASNTAPEEVKQGEQTKNVVLGAAALCGLLLGLTLLCCGCGGCFSFLCLPSEEPHKHRRRRYHADSLEDALEAKAKAQARELRMLRQQLAEGDLRRKLVEQERKLEAAKAKLAKQRVSRASAAIDSDDEVDV